MDNRQTAGSALTFLRLAQNTGWLVLAALPALWVNLWGQQPFELSKAIFVRTAVWFLAGLVLVEHCLTRRSLRRELLTSPLAGPLGVLALVISVTTITAVDWRLSLWGSYERAQGTVTLLTYLLLTLLAAGRSRSTRGARGLVVAMAVTAAPLILLGLIQGTGWNPLGLASDARSPLYATLGRANFLAAYLVMLVPLTLALRLTADGGRLRVLWSILLAGELLVVALTLARSAWLAAAVSVAIFALLVWGAQLAPRWRLLGWSGVGFLCASGPLYVYLFADQVLGSTAARLEIWKATIKLIARRPFLGYGADSLGLVFPGVYPPELVYYHGREFYVDRAHNILLDWAMIAGIPGLVAFLLVFVTFVVVATRALRAVSSEQQRVLLAAIVAAVVANLANNLVSFDVTPTATAAWLLMGTGVAMARPARRPPLIAVPVPLQRRALAALVIACVVCAVWQVNVRPLLADVAARAAHRHAADEQLDKAVASAEAAGRRWPAEPAYYVLRAQDYWQQAGIDAAGPAYWLGKAESTLRAARDLRPADVRLWVLTAAFYRSAAVQFGSDTGDLANNAYRQALSLAPNDATIYTAWGRAYLDDGDANAAARLLREAVRLDATQGEAYLYLATAEQALGRLEIAVADYQEALRLVPGSSEAYTGLAASYWQLNRQAEALAAAEAALERDPDNGPAATIRGEILRARE